MVELFLFGTAVVFTMFGYSLGRKKVDRELIEQSVASTVDSLIKDGYLKTVGTGKDMVILKCNYQDDQTDRT
jgi:hypothetical protein